MRSVEIDPIGERIEAVRQAASAQTLLAATAVLATSDHGNGVNNEAIACLVEVLGFNNPGAAVAAVDGLIALGPEAVEPILESLDPRNYGARAWAVRALAGIGDVRGLDLLEEALASDIGPSVRRAAARGLGQLRLAGLPREQRHPIAARCLEALLAGCGDGEWVVRYAVVVGLEALAPELQPEQPGAPPRGLAQLRSALERLSTDPAEDASVVNLRAALALQRLAPLSAAEGAHG
ncbi:HEAT repeat domain-containing protein [Synechococcus sp. HJ21-Hayes]|uniref:HEAT repeat domain-containing protein n=1 Tax=unclassified Synechococcus TaxID=2626047 RepID=UPI0020CC9C00|nr:MULTISPECIES: HEAT repeat domain-containing protein [unclassified Synechococcus]MCP9830636.1 HEAT repeat domain-containing protein [Synechococcus sp. JJ3a-Johnson]MCP9851351.1 HEAT repeat domain-containing protein [Synechococcus sp. HJ21-Hayes]